MSAWSRVRSSGVLAATVFRLPGREPPNPPRPPPPRPLDPPPNPPALRPLLGASKLTWDGSSLRFRLSDQVPEKSGLASSGVPAGGTVCAREVAADGTVCARARWGHDTARANATTRYARNFITLKNYDADRRAVSSGRGPLPADRVRSLHSSTADAKSHISPLAAALAWRARGMPLAPSRSRSITSETGWAWRRARHCARAPRCDAGLSRRTAGASGCHGRPNVRIVFDATTEMYCLPLT